MLKALAGVIILRGPAVYFQGPRCQEMVVALWCVVNVPCQHRCFGHDHILFTAPAASFILGLVDGCCTDNVMVFLTLGVGILILIHLRTDLKIVRELWKPEFGFTG